MLSATAVADNIFNTQPVKVLFFNMIIHLKYTIIMFIQSIHTVSGASVAVKVTLSWQITFLILAMLTASQNFIFQHENSSKIQYNDPVYSKYP